MATENMSYGDTSWSKSITLTKKSQTATLATAEKYVDKDISLTVTAQSGAGTVGGGTLTHSEITGDTAVGTYLQDSATGGVGPITFTNTASRAATTFTPTTGGWIDSSNAGTAVTQLSASGTDTKTLTKYVKSGTAKVNTGQSIPVTGTITNNNGVLTASLSGSKSIVGSATPGWVTGVSSATVSASGTATANATDLDSNLVASNIIKGKTILGVTGTGASADPAVFGNTALEGQTYKDVSADAPVLISGDYLYISEGAIQENQKISLAKLVPNGSNVEGNEALVYKTVSVYDNDGALVAGSMQDASIKSGAPSISGTPSVGTYNSTAGKYPLTATINVAAPSIISSGYITSTIGTKSTNSGSVTINLDPASCTVEGGSLTAGAGSSSINVNGYWDGSSLSTTDKIDITSQTTAAAGYYKIGTTGKGTVNRGAITDTHTAGWLPAMSKTNVSDATSLSSNNGTSTYYIKKSSGSSQTFTPSNSEQSMTIGAGYYPTDRVITVSAIDPSQAGQVTQGTLSADDSTINSVTASAGTASIDISNYKYNIPLTLNASGTAYAKVSTAGYVTTAKNTSKALTGTGSATVALDLYNGAFSWV